MRPVDRRLFPLIGALLSIVALTALACGDDEGAANGTAEASPDATIQTAGEVPGVSDSEVVFGTHFPLSQSPAAAYSPIANGMTAYFDYVNDTEGGVNGRKIRLIVCDDHYNPPDALECVRRLVEQDRVFGIIGGLGTAAHSAVWKYLEDEGIPDMWILTGAVKWTDPVVKTRFGGNPDYIEEGTILGRYIAENHDGKKLAIVAQNDDFGIDGMYGLRQGIEGSSVEIVTIEKFESTATDLTAQLQRAQEAGAQVLAVYGVPPQAANAIKVTREVLAWDVPIVVSGVSASDITISLAGAENAEGVVSVVFAHQIHETDHPEVVKHIDIMRQYDPDVEPSNFTLLGQAVAELTVEALKKAGPELTRESFLDGAESICDFTCLACLAPISFSPTDHRPFQIEVYARVEDGVWKTFGEPVDFESTTNCNE